MISESDCILQVALEVVQLDPNVEFKAPVYIEAALGRDTIFALDYIKFTPSLISPDGEEITLGSNSDCKLNIGRVSFFVCSFSNAQVGKYVLLQLRLYVRSSYINLTGMLYQSPC